MENDTKLENLEELSAKEILEIIYKNKLDSKKNILECIDFVAKAKKNELNDILVEDKIQEVYTLIYKSIDGMAAIVKPNTIMFLKNELRSRLGKYVQNKDPKEINHFLEFFKEAYPPKTRRKDFTWVLMDINKISNDQIWHTITYINAECINGYRLTFDEKEDILMMLNRLVKSNDINYINKVKSLQKLGQILNIKILKEKNGFKLSASVR